MTSKATQRRGLDFTAILKHTIGIQDFGLAFGRILDVQWGHFSSSVRGPAISAAMAFAASASSCVKS
jgi:hypothetical protein